MDIADDVLFPVKALGKREKKSIGQLLSELARKGLANPGEEKLDFGTEAFFCFRPLPSRGVVITSELIDKLREDEFN